MTRREETRQLSAHGCETSRTRASICLASVVLLTLAGGSANIFGLYGPRLIRDLSFTQYHVSTISTVLMASIYSMIPVFGRVCQLTSPRFLSLLSAVLFGLGYISMERLFSANFASRSGAVSGVFGFATSICAFACIGSATSAVIMASMAACARTFEKSALKGVFMSLPVASLGVSGILHSSIAVAFFSMPSKSGGGGHELSVVHLFRFLAALPFVTGILGGLGLSIPENPLTSIDVIPESGTQTENYGTIRTPLMSETAETSIADGTMERDEYPLVGFLCDPVLWSMALANLLLQGACEVYNMNLASIIQSNIGGPDLTLSLENIVAQHIAALATASTFARLSGGFLFDRFPSSEPSTTGLIRFSFLASLLRSPILIYLIMGLFGVSGLGLLAVAPGSAHIQLLMATTLIGLAYGAGSSLAPLATLIWSPKQFPIAYGIINMTPAIGIGFYNLFYSHWYEEGIYPGKPTLGTCFGWRCYGEWATSSTIGALASLIFVLLAWRTLQRRNVAT